MPAWCPLPLGEPSLKQSSLRMGRDLNSCGNQWVAPRRKLVLNTAKMAQGLVGTEAWDPFLGAAGLMGSHLGPCLSKDRACLLIALALASLLSSASFQHIPESIHPLNRLKSIEHQLFARHLFHRGEQSKYRPAPTRFLFKIASG